MFVWNGLACTCRLLCQQRLELLNAIVQHIDASRSMYNLAQTLNLLLPTAGLYAMP